MRVRFGVWAALVVAAVLGGCAKSAEAGKGAGAGSESEAESGTGKGTGKGTAGRGGSKCDDGEFPCYEACLGAVLGGGGRVVGEGCNGDCSFDLTFRPQFDLEHARCAGITVHLVVHNVDGTQRTFIAHLQSAALVTFFRISEAIDVSGLEPNMECPDCGFPGAEWVETKHGDVRSAFHFQRGKPPEPLREANEFAQQLIDELIECKGSALIERCSELIPECRFAYTNTNVANALTRECVVGGADKEPCRTALRCLCGGGVNPFAGSVNVDDCLASWLTPRGAITFTDFCSDERQSFSITLAEALTGFAQAYHSKVVASDGCNMITALY